MKEKKNKKVIHKLKSKYRLTILNENTFSEKFSVLLSPLNVIAILASILILFGGLVFSVVAFTPLKEYVIPGYTDDEYRENATYSRYMVDSLMKESAKKDLYLDHLQKFMRGEIVELAPIDSLDADSDAILADYEVSEEDSLLRNRLAQESQYELNTLSQRESGLKNLFLFKPLNGTLSGEFDSKIGHYGIDLIAPKNEIVKSVMDGTIILSNYTTNDGYVVQVQHDHNLISMYKHNSAVFKEVGDLVKAGDAIAVIGDSGDHTDGPHLHFELWLEGVPINPLEYYSFE